MELGKEVMDKQLLDGEGRRCGKVDDLLLLSEDNEPPVVSAILAQQGALAQDMGQLTLKLALFLYRLLGVRDAKPVEIDWRLVEKLDVVVHMSKSRSDLGLDRLQRAVGERVMSKIPGA